MIKGNNVCVIFDWDFDSYLIDHALAIKAVNNPFVYQSQKQQQQEQPSNQEYFEKAGMNLEDIRNVVKLAVHLDIKENSLDNEQIYSSEPSFQITQKTLKLAFINYR